MSSLLAIAMDGNGSMAADDSLPPNGRMYPAPAPSGWRSVPTVAGSDGTSQGPRSGAVYGPWWHDHGGDVRRCLRSRERSL